MGKFYELNIKQKVLLNTFVVMYIILYSLIDTKFYAYQASLYERNCLIFIPSLNENFFIFLSVPLFIGLILILVKMIAPSAKKLKLWHGILVTSLSLVIIITVLYFELGSFIYVEPYGIQFHTLLNSKTYHWSDVSKVTGGVRSFGKSGWHYQYELVFKDNSSIDIARDFGNQAVFDDGEFYCNFENLKLVDDSIRAEKVDILFSQINDSFYKDAQEKMGWTDSQINEFKYTFHQEKYQN